MLSSPWPKTCQSSSWILAQLSAKPSSWCAHLALCRHHLFAHALLQVNAQAASSDPAADPLSAAVQILNNQLSSLVWIDSQAKALSRRVDEVQR